MHKQWAALELPGNGRNIKTLGDQFQEDTDALAASQKAFDRCQATPKPMNCGATVMRNLQAGLDASKKAYDETAAKIKVSKEQSAQVKAAQDKLA